MKYKLSLLFLITFSLFVACSQKKEEMKNTQMESKKSDVVTFHLTGNDQMQYNLHKMEVPAGSTVRVDLKHIGKMNKDVMGHNFVLLKQNVDLSEFTSAAMTAKQTDFIPESKKDQIIAHTKLVGGGDSTFVEFKAPAVGTYKYICSFPGHYVTMQGDFIVK